MCLSMFFRFSLQTRGQALANSLSLTHSPQQTHIQSLSLSLYLTRVEPSHSLCLSHSRHVQSVIFGQTQTIFPSLSLPFYLSLFHFPLSNILSLFSILIYSPSLSISSISLPLSSNSGVRISALFDGISRCNLTPCPRNGKHHFYYSPFDLSHSHLFKSAVASKQSIFHSKISKISLDWI